MLQKKWCTNQAQVNMILQLGLGMMHKLFQSGEDQETKVETTDLVPVIMTPMYLSLKIELLLIRWVIALVQISFQRKFIVSQDQANIQILMSLVLIQNL